MVKSSSCVKPGDGRFQSWVKRQGAHIHWCRGEKEFLSLGLVLSTFDYEKKNLIEWILLHQSPTVWEKFIHLPVQKRVMRFFFFFFFGMNTAMVKGGTMASQGFYGNDWDHSKGKYFQSFAGWVSTVLFLYIPVDHSITWLVTGKCRSDLSRNKYGRLSK